MSSDRMKLPNCFANKIQVGPRLPFATRTILSPLQKSMREAFDLLINSCGTRPDSYRDDPAAETKSMGQWADARVVMVFARHLDNFIVT